MGATSCGRTFSVAAWYHDPWTMDEAERLVINPMAEEIDAAIQAVIDRYQVSGITIHKE